MDVFWIKENLHIYMYTYRGENGRALFLKKTLSEKASYISHNEIVTAKLYVCMYGKRNEASDIRSSHISSYSHTHTHIHVYIGNI